MSRSEWYGHAWWYRTIVGVPRVLCPTHGSHYVATRKRARAAVYAHADCPYPPSPRSEALAQRLRAGRA